MFIVIEGCTEKKYGRSCCRNHYYSELRHRLGPCVKCGLQNAQSASTMMCPSCYGQSDRRKDLIYKRRYGIGVRDYNEMFASQSGVCAICKQPPRGNTALNGRMHVDHCHKTNKVRGLLCFTCNTAIGKLKDNPELLRKAADYLERNNNGTI